MRNPDCQRFARSMLAIACLALGAPAVLAQTGAITGRVTDVRSKQGLDLVALEVQGTRLTTTAGTDGRYRIANVPAGQHIVVARRLGYAAVRQTVTVPADGEVTANFALDATAVALDQMVITGTAGGEERRSISNAVSTIDARAELDKSAASTITSLLNARSPGLTIQTTSGRLGATPAIQIRGRSSLSLANNPLVYIDGVRVSSATGLGPAGTGGLGTQGALVAGRLNDINPDDIESIEVISGPAASTIYGTEATSGVIQILTKKGAAGNQQMTGQVSVGSLSFRDAEHRVQTNYAKDKAGNLVTWNGIQQEADSGRPVFKTGLTRQYYTTAAGGGGATRYYVGAGYENDYGIEPNNSSRALTAHANVSAPLGSKSDVATSLNFVARSDHLGADVGASALLGAEVGHSLLFPAAGGFYPNYPPAVPQTLYDNSDGTNRFTGSATLNNRPLLWFTQRAILGLDYIGEDSRAIERYAPANLTPFLSTAAAPGRIGQTLRHNTIITADYNGSARANLTSALTSNLSVGGQFYNTEQNLSFLGGRGFPAPGVETVSATTTAVAAAQEQTINTTIGAYAQEQIGWHDRLFLTAAMRVDNNSAFGNEFKWVTYPKVGASWVVSEEPFWHWSAINTLRLRTAYGESGRQPVAFSALRTFTPVTGANGLSGVTPGTIGNPDLKPERGKELEAGVESEFFSRLAVNLTYFSRRTLDEIVNQNVAPSSGFPGSRSANLGRVDNHGIELQSSFQAIQRRNLAWEITGNVATNKDVIKDLGGLPTLITAAGGANKVGYPIGGIFSRRVVSADRDANGFATNVKCDGEALGPVACSTAPFVYLGTPTPGVTGSVANTVTFGPLRLYGLVDFKRGYLQQSTTELLRCTAAIGVGLCRINYFPLEFDVLRSAEAVSSALSQNYLDQYFVSGNFVKLREVSATYAIPSRWLHGMSHTSFTLAARELHTWTQWRGLDPEAYAFGSDQAVTPPLARVIATFNLQW
jgi:TonB-linked SusC/RagA family outer membrane protein